jgi:hypothetical protein
MVVTPGFSNIGKDKPWTTLFFDRQGSPEPFPFQTRFLTQQNPKLA